MLRKRLLEICYKHKLSHIGSCLTALPIIEAIYENKNEDDLFVLSSGHAGLALYVVLEAKYGLDAEQMLSEYGIHPVMDIRNKHIACSTGSLGMGITVAVGLALADRNRKVHCLLSDGECAEGSVWESLSFKEKIKLDNLIVYCNMNGYSAYEKLDTDRLTAKLLVFCPDINIFHTKPNSLPFAKGLDAHYHVMSKEDYEGLNL